MHFVTVLFLVAFFCVSASCEVCLSKAMLELLLCFV